MKNKLRVLRAERHYSKEIWPKKWVSPAKQLTPLKTINTIPVFHWHLRSVGCLVNP